MNSSAYSKLLTLDSNIPSNYSIEAIEFGIYYDQTNKMYYENLAGQ